MPKLISLKISGIEKFSSFHTVPSRLEMVWSTANPINDGAASIKIFDAEAVEVKNNTRPQATNEGFHDEKRCITQCGNFVNLLSPPFSRKNFVKSTHLELNYIVCCFHEFF